MIALPLLSDNPSQAPCTPLVGPADWPRCAPPPWDGDHPAWLVLDADLPEDHLARWVAHFVEQLDLQPLRQSYAGRGSLPCSPQLLLRLVFFDYLRGRTAPSQWLLDTQESCPVRWLLLGLQPARSTLYAFRDRIGPFLDGWHQQLLSTALAEGYTTGQRAALDGSILRARASRHHLLTETGLRRRCQLLEETIADDLAAQGGCRRLCPLTAWAVLVAVAVWTTPPSLSADAKERPSGAEMLALLRPPSLQPAWMARTSAGRQQQRHSYRRALRRCRAKKKRQQAKSPCRRKNKNGKGDKKVSVCVSEAEAALGRDKLKVFRPLYNTQIVRDLDSEFIVGFGTFSAQSDSGLLPVMMGRTEKLVGWMPEVVVADKSYATVLDLLFCSEHNITLYTPLDSNKSGPANSEKKYGKESFRYDAARDVYVCPAGQELRPGRPRQESRVGGKTVPTVSYQAHKGACAGCPQRARCTQSQKGRIIKRSAHEGLLEASRQRLASPLGQSTYRLRKQTVELSMARLKGLLGGDEPLSSYGKRRARIQVGMATLLLNALALFKARQRAARLAPPPGGGGQE